MINIMVFIFLFAATVYEVPYIAHREIYSSTDKINPMFRIAILDEGKPAVIRWNEYQRNPNDYKDKLIVTPPLGFQVSESDESFTLKKTSDGQLSVEGYQDLIIWLESNYLIVDNLVQPKKFWFSSVFDFFYAFLIAAIGTPLLSLLCEKYVNPVFCRWWEKSRMKKAG